MEPVRRERGVGRPAMDSWDAWPVSWSAVWVGALTAVAVALLFGLIGLALGAFQTGAGNTDWETVGFLALALSVFGAFLAFVAGGWVAGRIAGFRRAEPAMLHGGIVWLVAVPLLLVLAALGAGGFFGMWFSGLGGIPAWVGPTAAAGGDAADATRNSALGALTALLLGLLGSVLGGWMASGEPMSPAYYRTRETASERRAA